MQTSLQSDSVMRFFITTENLRGRLDAFSRLKALFERSELLIPTRGTSQKKIPSVCGCVCSTNLGFSVGKIVLVLVVGYQRAPGTSEKKEERLVSASASLPTAGSALPPVGRATPLLWCSDVNIKQ